jgi:hypothetical protein
MISLPPPFFFLLPIPGTVSTGLIFPFTYMCTQYLYTHTLSWNPLPSQCYQTPRQDMLSLSVLWFCKRKNWHFCLFKIVIQGVSLWHFHLYMYYNPLWFITSIFVLSTLAPF